MKLYKVVYILSLWIPSATFAQQVAELKERMTHEYERPSPFLAKWYVGVSENQYWGKFVGDTKKPTYAKPCMGFTLRAEYYPWTLLGVSLGWGIQGSGSGYRNPDTSGGAFAYPWQLPQNNGDSTYREKLRRTNMEVPLALIFRTPNDIIKGVRLSASAGVVYVHTITTRDWFIQVEDGYHVISWETDQHIRNELTYQLSLGGDINTLGTVFQVQFVYSKNLKNVYTDGQGDARP